MEDSRPYGLPLWPGSFRIISPRARATVIVFMSTSVALTVVNKVAVGKLHAGTVLVFLQLFATCLFAVALHGLGLSRIRGSKDAALQWIPVGFIYGVLIWTGMQSARYASLSTLTVFRNASSLVILVAEWLVFGDRPTCAMTLSLAASLFGMVLYALGDWEASADLRGVMYIAGDNCLVCLTRLLRRYFLQLQPIDLSTGALVFVENSVGLVPVILLLLGPCSSEWADMKLGPGPITWGFVSLPPSVAIAFVAVSLSRELTATGATLVSNMDKVLVLVYGVMVMGDELSGTQFCGCTIALVGGAWHAWARSIEGTSSLHCSGDLQMKSDVANARECRALFKSSEHEAQYT
eukprot:TRINITY_DN36966_c0_g1_i1.p1 TRINITY_DN36966_c0_g1~~TRINITY_DN36966_c0_g1_i1.p1  ORF type:complete len:350 (-),score=15.81 TRINITY_DN36966_c0_g1_i1:17-1066(-)